MEKTEKINLKSLSEDALYGFVESLGLPRYRARQLVHWIYERSAESIDEITELSKPLRARLGERAFIGNLVLREKAVSGDGTEKYLFELEDGNLIESVLIADTRRLTLCVSSQVGCARACRFCLTGKAGFVRNLEAHEIVDQFLAARGLAPRDITNIVFMGMGEPLDNLENVAEALWRLTGLARFSRRRITLSTSGVVPALLEFPHRAPRVKLAVSLNATTDQVRGRIMPVGRRHNLESLMDALRRYPLANRERITFEYVLIEGINDTPGDAKRLVRLLRGIPSKINLIPFNRLEGARFSAPSPEKVLAFQEVLTGAGYTAPIRKSKGQDILAACGQLRARRL